MTNKIQTMFAWMKKRVRSFRGAGFVALSVITTGYNIAVALNTTEHERHFPILYGTQAAIILIICAIIAFGEKPASYPNRYPRATLAVKQFWRWWAPLWFAWLILYAALFFSSLYSVDGTGSMGSISPTVRFGLHQLNNVATLILLMLFHVLAQPSVPSKMPPESKIFAGQQGNDGMLENKVERIVGGEFKFWFWVALFLVSAMFEFALIRSQPSIAKEVLAVSGIIYGLAGAAATALVVGKLNDHYLGVPTGFIVILFLYSGLQPSFDFLVSPNQIVRSAEGKVIFDTARDLIVVSALVGKVALFVVIQWLSMTDRLLYYMVQSYATHRGVGEHRQKFLEVLRAPFAAATSIANLNKEWLRKGYPAKDRAELAWGFRHKTRLLSRQVAAKMTDVDDLLRQRKDLVLGAPVTSPPGSPDTLQIDSIVQELKKVGYQADDDAYEAIIEWTTRLTDAEFDKLAEIAMKN